jgi:hypothetical protein
MADLKPCSRCGILKDPMAECPVCFPPKPGQVIEMAPGTVWRLSSQHEARLYETDGVVTKALIYRDGVLIFSGRNEHND